MCPVVDCWLQSDLLFSASEDSLLEVVTLSGAVVSVVATCVVIFRCGALDRRRSSRAMQKLAVCGLRAGEACVERSAVRTRVKCVGNLVV